MTDTLPSFDDVRAAAERLSGRIVRTPLLRHRAARRDRRRAPCW